jgi:hypothetical protein
MRWAGARDGIQELILRLGASDDLRSKKVLLSVHSAKSFHLIATDCKPARTLLVRPHNEFTVRYTDQTSSDDPAFDNHAEVARNHDGRLYFREMRDLLTVPEFASRLMSLAVLGLPSHR